MESASDRIARHWHRATEEYGHLAGVGRALLELVPAAATATAGGLVKALDALDAFDDRPSYERVWPGFGGAKW